MRDDFCVLILSHGRAGNVRTLRTLEAKGYTGDWYIVIDHEDDIQPYEEEYGADRVVYFDKEDVIPEMDRGDNFDRRNSILYARFNSFAIAEELGYDYFMQMDDDFQVFQWRFNEALEYEYNKVEDLDSFLEHMVDFLEESGLDTVCISQGGDFIGGEESQLAQKVQTKRKAMNTFVCKTDRRFDFRGSVNEDVNTYVRAQQLGKVFLTVNVMSFDQSETQQQEGGLTDLYLAEGTYVKSFYTILYSPSSVRLQRLMDRTDDRIHHQVNWRRSVPKILPESAKK